MLLSFVKTSLSVLVLILALRCWLQANHHSQEAEEPIVLEVRSYERMVAKTVSLNSQKNRFQQRRKISEIKRFSRIPKQVLRTDREAARRHKLNTFR